jgi:SMI1 / KNR4 family (SUKH-1)
MIGTSLKNYWLSQGIEVNPGVSKEELSAFESKYQVGLPADLRDYFLTVDGMVQGVTDNALIRFWSLNEVKPIPEEAPDYSDPSYIEGAESLFLFADYCIWSHAYTIRLSSTEASNPIIIIGDETPTKIFSSFSELVSSYLTDADLLLSNIKESPEG